MNYRNVEKFIDKYIRAVYLLFLSLVSINILWLKYDTKLAIVSLGLLVSFYIFYLYVSNNYKKEIYRLMTKYEEQVVEYKKEANLNVPIPYIVIDIHGDIKWVNSKFKFILKEEKIHHQNISELFPDINVEEIIENTTHDKLVELNDRYYQLSKQVLKIDEGNDDRENLLAIYLSDITDYNNIKKKCEEDEIVVGYFFIDNFQEVIDSIEELKGPMLLGIIERRLGKLGQELDAIVKKIDRDRFMFIFHKHSIQVLYDTKFDILDDMRRISIGNELPVTLSIGIGVGGKNLIGTSEYAKEALELSLGRGGDQAVIKESAGYEFFGGKNKKDLENTLTGKARARIKAYAFKELVNTVDKVLIMGHRNPDLDCLGAAMGIYRAVETLGKKPHIVLNEVTAAIESLFERVEECGEYTEDTFIKTSEALQKMDKDTLLVVVDVNQPNYLEAPKLFEVANRVVLIDHHIRTENSIENATLTYQEAYASSTSELVTQLLQYVDDNVELKEVEADALIAGIIVDTKNFIFKTGVKTFEAAAFLRRNGADSTRVKVLFQNDLESYKSRAEAIRSTEIYKEHFAIAIFNSRDENDYLMISQLADELLSITGVKASFVLCQIENNLIILSARSLGEINVEIVAEKLGGGGHFTAAGAQIKSNSMADVKKDIKKKIDEFLKEGERK